MATKTLRLDTILVNNEGVSKDLLNKNTTTKATIYSSPHETKHIVLWNLNMMTIIHISGQLHFPPAKYVRTTPAYSSPNQNLPSTRSERQNQQKCASSSTKLTCVGILDPQASANCAATQNTTQGIVALSPTCMAPSRSFAAGASKEFGKPVKG